MSNAAAKWTDIYLDLEDNLCIISESQMDLNKVTASTQAERNKRLTIVVDENNEREVHQCEDHLFAQQIQGGDLIISRCTASLVSKSSKCV